MAVRVHKVSRGYNKMSKIMSFSGFSLIWKLLLLAKCWRAQGQESGSPIITNCPNNLKIDVPSPFQSLRVFWEEPTAVDDNGLITVTKSHTSGAIFPADQTTIVQYVFTNSGRRSSECQFEILLSRTCDVLMPCVDNGLCYNDFRSTGECMLVPFSYTLCNHSVDTTPPNCVDVPNNIFVTVELGISGTAVFWNEPTCTDDSGKASIFSRSHSPSTYFTVGETTVLYTCEDMSGNTNTCTFTVIVTSVDTTPPTISNCPSDVTLFIELGGTEGTVFWIEPPVTDISGTAVLSSRSHNPGSSFPIGATRVTYEFSDASGNIAVCTFDVVVNTVDTTPPTISNCPSDVALDIEIGGTGGTVFWLEPTATDISGVAVLSTRSHNPGSSFPLGATRVTFEFSDASGNIAVCAFDVVVNTVNSTFSSVCNNIPVDIVETVELGTNGTIITWREPTCSDTFGNAAVLLFKSHTPPSFFTVGTTTVNYTCLSSSGNVAWCDFTVTINAEDTTPPAVICVEDLQQTIELGVAGAIVVWTEPTATDISGFVSLESRSHNPGSMFDVGQTIVTYIFSDSSGNTASCIFVVEVIPVDTTPPMCENLPTQIVEVVELGTAGTVVNWAELSCSDVSGTGVVTARSHTPFSFFVVGTTIVLYTCTDESGNSDSCSFPVTVIPVDTTPPMCVNIPAGVSDTVELGTPGTLVSWTELTCSDLSGTPEVTSRSHIPNSFFTVGSTDVTYICIDASGNTESCVFPVTVIAIDTTPPQCVNLPNEISRTVTLGTPGIEISWIEPTCSDISGTASITTRSHTPPSFFSVGMATVSYTCTDLSGNSETCTFPVTVSTAPHNCPENIIVETNVAEQTANVFWKETFENNTVWNKSAYLTASHAPGDDFLLGNTMVLYTFYDADGIIIDSCQFCVTVVSGGMIVGCPRHAIVTSAKGMSTNVTWHNPVVLSDGSPRNLSSLTKVSPGDSFKVGVTRVTYREDKAICRFTIIVKDITPPELVHCTQDILVQLQPGETSSEVNWVVPKARDYESEFVCVQSTHSPGDRFEAGLTTVTYTFSDNAGNEATCKFGVHVARADDTNPPNIVNCPESVLNYEFQEREDNYEVFWRTPTATDDLNLPIAVSSSHSNRDRFSIGSTDVTYIFTDVVGNVATCRFEVYISVKNESQERLRFKQCPCDVVKTLPSSNDSIQVLWDDPTLVGSFRGISVSQTHHSGDFFKQGRTHVVYIALSVGEVIARCQFLVDIIDSSPPYVINCPSFVSIRACRGSRTANWMEPYSMDNSGNKPDIIFQSHLPRRSLFKYGNTSVTYLFRDSSGNTIACNFTVNLHRNGCNFLTPVILITFAVIIFIVLLVGLCCPCVIVPLKLKSKKKDKNDTSPDTDSQKDSNSLDTDGAVADEEIPLESLDMTADVHAQDKVSYENAELA